MSATSDITGNIARFAVETERLPENVVNASALLIVNAIVLALHASANPHAKSVRRTLSSIKTPEDATVLGTQERMSVSMAALANGFAMNLDDFDDTHLDTMIHPGPSIVAAAMAVAEWRNRSAEELLQAVAIGIEVTTRIGAALTTPHMAQGWHISATMNHFGTATAAGRLLDLDDEGMRMAIGLAATQASGLGAALGTMTKPFHFGKAAANGIESALLAKEGFTAASYGLEGRRGFAALAADNASLAPAIEEIGERWELLRVMPKPYPCGIVSHPIIDAGLELRKNPLSTENLEEAVLRVHSDVARFMDNPDPQDALQAKLSVQHCFAAAFVHGRVGPGEFLQEVVEDRRLSRIRERVRLDVQPSIRRDEALVTVTASNGEEGSVHVKHATGSEHRPFNWEDLTQKASTLLSATRSKALVEELRSMLTQDSPLSTRELIDFTQQKLAKMQKEMVT